MSASVSQTTSEHRSERLEPTGSEHRSERQRARSGATAEATRPVERAMSGAVKR
jgi:hypothetical protein